MARPPARARGPVLFLLAAATAGCASGGEPVPDAGPSMPPGAVAAAPRQSLTARDVRDLRVARAEELLAGRFAGVEVLRLPGGGLSVRIRGPTSLALSTEPLYVIDGVPMSNLEPGDELRWLNPGDIARIEVLKDPAETAIYGLRGANGVILITTKH